MKLYFLRHGQSEDNCTGVFCGWSTCNLTETGRAQAALAAPLLQDIPFEKVYSSDLPRAMQTIHIAYPFMEPETSPLLREINVGALKGLTPAICEATWGRRFIEARALQDYTSFGGESYAQLGQRMERFLEQVAQQHTGNILVASHQHAIATVLNMLYGNMTEEMSWMSNCGISVFEYRNGKWKLLQWNMTAQPIR